MDMGMCECTKTDCDDKTHDVQKKTKKEVGDSIKKKKTALLGH